MRPNTPLPWNVGKPSLSKDFAIIAALLAMGIFATLIWLGFTLYSHQKRDRLYSYSTEGDRLDASLRESFDYVSHYAKFLGDKIIEHGKADPDYIAELFYSRGQVDPEEQKLYSWTKFDWINPDKQMTVSTKHGVLKEKKDMRLRSYLNETPVHPWRLRFSEPAVGIPSGQWIIPTGVGVKDSHGKFLGTIGTGFSIERLREKLEKSSVMPGSSFIVLNSNHNIILQSVGKKCTDDEIKILRERTAVIATMNGDAGFLPEPIQCGHMRYVFFRSVVYYPFYFLIGEDIVTSEDRLKDAIYPRTIEFFSIWLLGLTLLYFFKRRLIQPVMVISNAAQKIAEGQEVTIPEGHYPEINLLAIQLKEIQRVKKELRTAKEEAVIAHMEVQTVNEHLEEKVKERTAALEKALAVKSEILNNVSHEIRSPVQGVAGISESLADSWDMLTDEKRLACVKEVRDCSQRLIHFVTNLLDFSKLGECKMNFDMKTNDLTVLIDEVIEEVKPLTVGKKITLKFEHNAPLPDMVFDYFNLGRVLRNLFSNAIKFTQQGTITASILPMEFENKNGELVKGIRFSLSDEGVGIPEAQLTDIFEPFTQSERTKTAAGGTGLGLSITKKIIEGHHGKIWAQNNPVRGAMFCFVLPLMQPTPTLPLAGIITPDMIRPPVVKPSYNVLAIDDESHCLMSMAMILESNGHKVTTVQGGRAGIQHLIDHPQPIDVVLLDMMMPDKSGLEVLVEMRQIPALRNIPVILQTGAASEDEIQEAFRYGIVSCIRKPYQKAALLDAIEHIYSSSTII